MTETSSRPAHEPPPFGITERARHRLAAVAAREGVDLGAAWLRVAVVAGGCSGLTYDLGWDTALNPDDEVVDLEGFRVALDLKSRLYVEGTTLDFTDGLEGKGFHFDNPQATRTCACGESFSL
ncbi:iron-sulfur cluster assembly accessory protein [Rubrivirga sp. S365]|uniref:HesB/IscA family protein n=1 Tax=Rubrivirga sp. S365 TaxID=3076080 RepID=UPI0028C8D57C|nr:iron-sulfur cluster assembly accessory protein [Rubrivirga sp. S365]MDT7857254.1 iron-sulfur cluster assembly accessory protein [Rubrivirga sp. S365]